MTAVSRRTFLAGIPAVAVIGASAPAGAVGGISWPAGQELPTFAAPERLDALFLSGATPVDVQLLVTTLQGLVNRTRPEIYVVRDEPSEGRRTWLDDSGIPYRAYTDPWKVINRHIERAKGVIVYDPEVVETVNVATTVAGLRGGVIASPELARKLTAAPYDKPILDDFRGRFTTGLEATTWQFENLWPNCNQRALLGINPGQAVPIPPDNWASFVEVIREERPIRDGSNRQVYELDLSPFAGGDMLYLRMQDSQPADGWGGAVHQVTITADGQPVVDFVVGDETERGVILDHGGAGFKGLDAPEGAHRFADGTGYFVYAIPVPAGATTLTASIDMFNQFLVSASKAAPLVSSDDRIPASLPLRDYAVAIGGMPFWLSSGDNPDEVALMERIFAAVDRGTPYLGWFSGEFAGVRAASAHGVYVLAADFLDSATVHGGFRAPIRPQPRAVKPPLQNKVYVTFTFAEGDNVQFCQHRLRQIWDDAGRGSVPINWSISPLLKDAAPLIISHYLTTATPNDLLVAGPSGAGYFYPSFWPQEHLPTFLAQNKPYFVALGLDMIYALDDIPALEEASAAAYVDSLDINGIVYNMWATRSDTTIKGGSLPVSTQISHPDPAEMLTRIRATAADFDGTAPMFIAVGVPAWECSPTDVAWMVEQLGTDFVAVRGDQYFDLVHESYGV